jgi:hypothetical protein
MSRISYHRQLTTSSTLDENVLKAWKLASNTYTSRPPATQFIDAGFSDNIYLWDRRYHDALQIPICDRATASTERQRRGLRWWR